MLSGDVTSKCLPVSQAAISVANTISHYGICNLRFFCHSDCNYIAGFSLELVLFLRRILILLCRIYGFFVIFYDFNVNSTIPCYFWSVPNGITYSPAAF